MLRSLKTQWWFGAVFQLFGAETSRRSRKLGAQHHMSAVTDELSGSLFVGSSRTGVLAFLGAGVGCLSSEQLVEIGVPELLKAATGRRSTRLELRRRPPGPIAGD